MARHFQQAFAAAAPARQTNVVRRQQVIYRVVEFLRAPIDITCMLINTNWSPKNPRRLMQRSIAAKTFSELIQTGIAGTLIDHFFTPQNIDSLESRKY